jgi:RNA polymerase sigma-70 factor (family 1)
LPVEKRLLMSQIDASRIFFLQTRIARFEDHQAYNELFLTLFPDIFRFTSGFVRSKAIAEEIISDVFIKIWEKRKDLELILNLKVYCYVIVKNLSQEYLKKQKRNSTLNIEDYTASLPNVYFDPEQLMISSEMVEFIQKAIDALPAQCKLIFILIKENDFKYKEVAEILGISVKTVENHLAIALKKISASIHFEPSRSVRLTTGARS